MKLSQTLLKGTYRIAKILAKPPLSYRLLSMGFRLGTPISLLTMTLAKGTMDVNVDGVVVALRKEEADTILVEECV